MIAGLDRDEHRQPHADRFRRDQRHPAQDDAGLLQALDALPARALRQADAMRDLRTMKGWASSCRRATIFLSIASMDQSPVRTAATPRRRSAACRSLFGKSQLRGFRPAVIPGAPGRRASAQALRQGLDIAAQRTGIAGQPAVGPVEPGQPPGAVLTDQGAHDATISGDGPQRRLAASGEEQARGAGNELLARLKHGDCRCWRIMGAMKRAAE